MVRVALGGAFATVCGGLAAALVLGLSRVFEQAPGAVELAGRTVSSGALLAVGVGGTLVLTRAGPGLRAGQATLRYMRGSGPLRLGPDSAALVPLLVGLGLPVGGVLLPPEASTGPVVRPSCEGCPESPLQAEVPECATQREAALDARRRWATAVLGPAIDLTERPACSPDAPPGGTEPPSCWVQTPERANVWVDVRSLTTLDAAPRLAVTGDFGSTLYTFAGVPFGDLPAQRAPGGTTGAAAPAATAAPSATAPTAATADDPNLARWRWLFERIVDAGPPTRIEIETHHDCGWDLIPDKEERCRASWPGNGALAGRRAAFLGWYLPRLEDLPHDIRLVTRAEVGSSFAGDTCDCRTTPMPDDELAWQRRVEVELFGLPELDVEARCLDASAAPAGP